MDLLLPKTKPTSVGIAYRPPKDTNVLQLFAEILMKLVLMLKAILNFAEPWG